MGLSLILSVSVSFLHVISAANVSHFRVLSVRVRLKRFEGGDL